MRPNEYVLTLMTIISGLAMSDIVVSFHRLLRARDRVRWDWLPLAAAAYVAVIVAFGWFVSWSVSAIDNYNPPFWRFLLILAQLIPLYLAAAAALPDEMPPDGVDLKEFYQRNNRYIWGALSAATLMFVVALALHQARGEYRTFALGMMVTCYLLPSLLLAVVGRRRVHGIVAPLLLIGTLLLLFRVPLTR